MAASKLDPRSLTTVKAVGGAVVEVHDCLHVVDQKIDVVKVQVAMLAAANGISLPTEEEMRSGAAPRKVRRRLGGMNPYKAAAVLMPAVAGGVGLYKVIEPAVIAFFTALHHALMTAH
jgi:hypothetical protein